MASFKNRQSSENNQSFPESGYVPESHSYQEKHFQPLMNEPVVEGTQYTEVGVTVTPDPIEATPERHQRSDVVEKSDQPGENDLLKQQIRQSYQGNSDSGTQYSTPDVSSGVSSGSEGTFTGASSAGTAGSAAAATTTATTTVAATATTATVTATISSVAVTAAAAVIIAATVIIPLLEAPQNISFSEIIVTDSSVYYSIYIEDYEEGMDLTVSLHNNFTNRQHTVDSNYVEFTERNLKPNMEYKLTLYGSMATVLKETVVKTQKTSGETGLTVNKAEFDATDGMIHVSAVLSDPNSELSDFKAVLYDDTQNRTAVWSAPIQDFKTDLTLDPGFDPDMKVSGTFALECLREGEPYTLYEREMSVYGLPYFGLAYPMELVDHAITLDCEIIDPEGLRSDYVATLLVEDASGLGSSFELTSEITGKTVTFSHADRIPGTDETYTFIDAHLTVVCTENGERKAVLKEDYSSYVSPAISVNQADMKVEHNTGAQSTSTDLSVKAVIVDKNGEWQNLKAVLSGTDGRGDPQEIVVGLSIDDLKQNNWTFSFPVSDYSMEFSTDITISFVNGNETLLTFTGLSMIPLVETGEASYDSSTRTATVALVNIVDSFGQWFDSDGEWIADSSQNPAIYWGSDPMPGSVVRSGSGYVAEFVLGDSSDSYVNRSLSFIMGNNEATVIFHYYTMSDPRSVSENLDIEYQMIVTGVNSAIEDSNTRITFNGTQLSISQIDHMNEDKIITFVVYETLLNTPGTLVVSIDEGDGYVAICQRDLTFINPVGVSLDYVIDQDLDTGDDVIYGVLRVDTKGLVDSTSPSLVGTNGNERDITGALTPTSGVYEFMFPYDDEPAYLKANILIEGVYYLVTATYTHNYTISNDYVTFNGDSLQGYLDINGPILSNIWVTFTAADKTEEGFDGSGTMNIDSKNFSFSLSEDMINVPGTLTVMDGNQYDYTTLCTIDYTFVYVAPTTLSATFVPGTGTQSQVGTATIVMDMSNVTVTQDDPPYLSDGFGLDSAVYGTYNPQTKQCTFTFEMESTYADGQPHDVRLTIGSAIYPMNVTFTTT